MREFGPMINKLNDKVTAYEPHIVCSGLFLADKSNKNVWFCFAFGRVMSLNGFEGLVHIPAGIVQQMQHSVGKKCAGHLSLCR